MTKRQIVLGVVAAIALTGSACTGFESGKTIGSPTAPDANVPGGSSSGSFVGSWGPGVQAFTVPSPSSCTNFAWTISSQSETAIAGSFTATCDGGVGINATASGVLNNPTTITLTISGVALVGGVPACTFTLNGVGTLIDNNTMTIPYTGDTCIGPVHGTETLRRRVDPPPAPPPPPPPPDPEPQPEPPPPGPPPGGDALNLGSVVVHSGPRDVANWPATYAISGISVSRRSGWSFDGGFHSWPDVLVFGNDGYLQYTVWPVVNVGGTWRTCGVVQMWRDRPSTGGFGFATWHDDLPGNWTYICGGEIASYRPNPGDTMGFFLTAGNARFVNGVTSVRERSNVVIITLPAGDTGTFAF